MGYDTVESIRCYLNAGVDIRMSVTHYFNALYVAINKNQWAGDMMIEGKAFEFSYE